MKISHVQNKGKKEITGYEFIIIIEHEEDTFLYLTRKNIGFLGKNQVIYPKISGNGYR